MRPPRRRPAELPWHQDGWAAAVKCSPHAAKAPTLLGVIPLNTLPIRIEGLIVGPQGPQARDKLVRNRRPAPHEGSTGT